MSGMGKCNICNEYSNALNSKRYCSQCQRAEHFANFANKTTVVSSNKEDELLEEIRHYRAFLINLTNSKLYSVCTGHGIKFDEITGAAQALLNKYN